MATIEPETFYLAGNEIGVLLIHGFTGSPVEMYPMGEYLAGRGLTVLGVRLAGHGRTPEEMAQTGWRDWVASAREGLERLRAGRRQVYVVGYSLGGVITLHLLSRLAVDGAVLLSTPLYLSDWRLGLVPLLKHLVRFLPMNGPESPDPAVKARFWCYDRVPLRCVDELRRFVRQTRRELPQVKTPLLIMQGDLDQSVPLDCPQEIYDRTASTDKAIRRFANSTHSLPAEHDCEEVWQRAYEFIARQAGL
jgi:carboxylesterase